MRRFIYEKSPLNVRKRKPSCCGKCFISMGKRVCMCVDVTSWCYQQAWGEVCADMSAARAMNEDNKADNRERKRDREGGGALLRGLKEVWRVTSECV